MIDLRVLNRRIFNQKICPVHPAPIKDLYTILILFSRESQDYNHDLFSNLSRQNILMMQLPSICEPIKVT